MPLEFDENSREWLGTAQEGLDAARVHALAPRFRCFHAQRAVELSLKGVLVRHGVEHPRTHALARLIEILPVDAPADIDLSARLTIYAVEEMYPETLTALDETDAREAVELAAAVVEWAASLIDP